MIFYFRHDFWKIYKVRQIKKKNKKELYLMLNQPKFDSKMLNSIVRD